MSISMEEARHVAALARLHFEGESLEDIARDLSRILDYVAHLDELDTTEIPPTSHVLPVSNKFREDEPWECLPRQKVAAMAPKFREGQVVVARVMPGEELEA